MIKIFEDFCAEHVETGKYISPEFRLGHVWDGRVTEEGEAIEDVILYRPVYVRIMDKERAEKEHKNEVNINSDWPIHLLAKLII